jgi:tetratricopeptide (TPR) repeat protein
MIVRPPGTLGHADYFGVYLLLAGFAGWAAAACDSHRVWRIAGVFAAAVAIFAVLLTGTRAALLGGAVGGAVAAWRLRPRMTRRHALAALAIIAGTGAFYVSPAGERLRARVRWSVEDAYGGARLWLWRDSLRAAAERPVLGHGPDTFHVVFPRFQSLTLARAYPDFQHESPHNILMDALTGQGIVGVIALAGLLIAGLAGAVRAPAESRKIAAVLLGSLTALTVSQQFCSFTVTTALCLVVAVAALVALAPSDRSTTAIRGTAWWMSGRAALACLFIGFGLRLTVADGYLARARDSLAHVRIPDAVRYYEKAAAWFPQGASADLYYSRAMAAAASEAPDPASAFHAWQQAMMAGVRAMHSSDDPANAAYNLASLCAASNDSACTESSLRAAIERSPSWFKPYWTLARLLSLSGRIAEAESTAAAAADRNGGRNEEVLQTLREIRQMRPKP